MSRAWAASEYAAAAILPADLGIDQGDIPAGYLAAGCRLRSFAVARHSHGGTGSRSAHKRTKGANRVARAPRAGIRLATLCQTRFRRRHIE